jgi:hypothetical protein
MRTGNLNHGRRFSPYIGAVAQLVERIHGMDEVRGSTPLGSTVYKSKVIGGWGVALALSLFGCAGRPVARVAYAEPTNVNAYSEVARIYVHNAHDDFCLGVLVHSRLVLTAAHCVAFNPPDQGSTSHGTWTVEFPAKQVRVRASGMRLFDARMQARTREDYFFHPEIVDAALLLLDEHVAIAPALVGDAEITALGTVIRRAQPRADAQLLLTGDVRVLSSSSTTLVSGRITGPGDSGGPFFRAGTHALLGIEARFDDTTDTWTRVTPALRSWIAATADAARP